MSVYAYTTYHDSWWYGRLHKGRHEVCSQSCVANHRVFRVAMTHTLCLVGSHDQVYWPSVCKVSVSCRGYHCVIFIFRLLLKITEWDPHQAILSNFCGALRLFYQFLFSYQLRWLPAIIFHCMVLNSCHVPRSFRNMTSIKSLFGLHGTYLVWPTLRLDKADLAATRQMIAI